MRSGQLGSRARLESDSPRKKAEMEAQARNLLLLSQKMKMVSPGSRNFKKKKVNSIATGESTVNHPLLRSNPDLIKSGEL